MLHHERFASAKMAVAYGRESGQMARWTQEEAIAFESARECITHLMAICSAEASDIRSTAEQRDGARARRARLAAERAGLRVCDHESIHRIRSVYGKECRDASSAKVCVKGRAEAAAPK